MLEGENSIYNLAQHGRFELESLSQRSIWHSVLNVDREVEKAMSRRGRWRARARARARARSGGFPETLSRSLSKIQDWVSQRRDLWYELHSPFGGRYTFVSGVGLSASRTNASPGDAASRCASRRKRTWRAAPPRESGRVMMPFDAGGDAAAAGVRGRAQSARVRSPTGGARGSRRPWGAAFVRRYVLRAPSERERERERERK